MESMKEVPYTHRTTREVATILDPLLLQTPYDLADALEELVRKINQPYSNLPEIVQDICAAPNLFEIVLSGLETTAAEKVVRALKHAFPQNDAARYQSSMARRLLERLSSYLSSYPDDWVQHQFKDACRSVPQLHCALDTLHDLRLVSRLGSRSRIDSNQVVAVKKAPFIELGIECPSTLREVQNAVEHLLKALKLNYEFFVMTLKGNKRFNEIAQNRYFRPESMVDGNFAESQVQSGDSSEDVGHHSFSRKKAALVLPAVEGFGDWRILLSSRAVRDLKKAHSRPPLYSSIIQMLRSLSRNDEVGLQVKMLSIKDSVVIYAATVHKGCAVVYCVDQVPSFHNQETEEAFRVFGIFNASALKDDFWKAFADQIASRRPQKPGSARSATEAQGHSYKADKAKANQYSDMMRSLLVTTKFMDLSQSVLHAIRNDEEILQVFQLSPEEQKIFDYDGSCYVLGRSGTGKTTVMMLKILATELTYQQYPDMTPRKPRQLFVTRSQNLASKVRETFDGMYSKYTRITDPSTTMKHRQRVLLNLEEEARRKCRRFGELTDDDFPLFLSFDHLCSMIEEELRFASPNWRGLAREQQITFEVFLHQYWPRLASSVDRDIDPSLFFGQFIGAIQGTEDSLSAIKGYISREKYVNMSRPATITQTQDRCHVYDLFEKYKKLKSFSKQHDIANRTHAILHGFVNAPQSLRGAVDFLFVDEAQDNLLIDTRLIRSLCSNPNGLFWAGDTAQTVFAGSAFTFNELTAFMWRTEQILPKHKHIKNPRFFELTANYRSQQGILACAQSVLDCIYTYWPSTLDRLPKEEGLSQGKRPMVFVRQDTNDELLKVLAQNASGSVELGAEQCIIMRNDAACENVRQETKGSLNAKTTQFLTVYQSKGLEFDDVIVYNFFKDSKCHWQQWRHLLRQFDAEGSLSDAVAHHDDARFDAIAQELKSLYVACTRARHNLWIIDTSEKIDAIRRIWEQKEQIVWQENEPDMFQFASPSNKSGWERKASEYFMHGLYKLSERAYHNAGLPHEAAVASAYSRRESAELSLNTSERSKQYSSAANQFNQVATETDKKVKFAYYRIAAECYVKVPDRKSAAVAYENAHEYDQAIKLYRDIGNFERTIQLLYEHTDASQPDDLLEVRYAMQIFCVLNVRIRDFTKLFRDSAEVLLFATRHGLAKVALLEHLKDLSEMVSPKIRTDRFVAAEKILIQLHLLGSTPSRPVFDDLVTACRRHMSIASIDWGDDILPRTKKVEKLLTVISKWESLGSAGQRSTLEFDVLRAIAAHDEDLLRRVVLTENTSDYVALLCLSHIVPPPTKWGGKTSVEVLEWLRMFLPMCHSLRDLCLQMDPQRNLSVQQTLGFRGVTSEIFQLFPDSAIEKQALARKSPFIMSLGDTSQYRLVSRNVLRNLLFHCLAGSLKRRVFEAVSVSRGKLEHQKSGHVSLRSEVECLLHMLMLLDDTRGLAPVKELQEEKRKILQDIHHVVTSAEHNSTMQLSLADELDVGKKDIRKGIHVVQTYVRESIVAATSTPLDRMTNLMKAFVLMFALRSVSPQPSYDADFDGWLPHRPVPMPKSFELQSMEQAFVDMINGRKSWSPRPLICLCSAAAVRKVPVDIDTLCSTIEFVTSWLSLLYSQSAQGDITGTVLSQHCLITYGQAILDSSVDEALHVSQARCLVMALAILLREVLNPRKNRTDTAFLYLRGNPMDPNDADRHIYMARLCEAMILLGHNVPVGGLRADILMAITSLRGSAKQSDSKLYRRYIAATTWADLVAALPNTLPVVALLRSSPLWGGGSTTYKAVPCGLPLIERRNSVARKLDSDPTSVDLLKDPPLLQLLFDVLDKEAKYQLKSMWRSLRVFAAIRIQRFYRRRLSNRRSVRYGSLTFLVNGAFTECLNEVRSIEWSNQRYRMVFLGVLPHALACLNAMIMQFAYMKSLASQRLQEAAHSQWEKLGHEVAAIHDNMEAAKVLRKQTLGPSSEIYRARLWQQFRTHIQEVEGLMNKLPPNSIQDLEKEWSVVRKTVLQRGKNSLEWFDAGFVVAH